MQQNYGPWNALADILGAYIQKRAIDGANEYASKTFQNEPVAQAQQNMEAAQSEAQHEKIVNSGQARQLQKQMNNGFQTNAMDSLKPNMNSSNDILMGAQGANGGPSMLKMMDSFAQQNNPAMGAAQPRLSMDTGLGTRIEAKTAPERALDQQRVQEAQTRAEAPMSYTDYVNKLKDMRSVAMKEMVRKYGVEAAKQAQGLIDDAYNQKVSSYADKMDSNAMKQLQGSLFGQTEDGKVVRKDLADRNNRVNFLFNLQNYNNQAKKMGQAGFDMNLAKELLATDAVKDVQIDSGGAIHVLGQRTDGSMHEIGVIKKSLSPKDIQASKDKAADRNLKVWQTNENNRVKKQIADDSNATRLRVAEMGRRSSSNGGSNAKARKWADTLQVGQEAALAAIRSGSTYDDYDDHSVEEFRQNCIKALESGELDDDDKNAVRQMMEGTMALYKEELDKRS